MLGHRKLLEGYLTKVELAAELGRCPRTIERLMNQPDGIPYVKVGNATLFKEDSVMAWLAAREQQRNARRAPRRGGRAHDNRAQMAGA